MFSYQKLEVYKKAFLLNKVVYNLLKENYKIPAYAKNQLGRASLSIVLNIAEGSAKFTKKDRRNFFVIARGSAFECAVIVDILYSENEIPLELKNELEKGFEEISKILYVMIRNLEKAL
ncbi:MAG: ribosomal protein [Chitinophagaceae bacterium]|nr:ribosomal protein [Chitinophagaceae bacterium]